jgi:hypothetical protein
MATAQSHPEVFFTSDMALAAYLIMNGYEVTAMSREPRIRVDAKGRTTDNIFWGFDKEEGLESKVLTVIGRGEVTLPSLYTFMDAIKQTRDLMMEYRRDPSIFEDDSCATEDAG